jgi:hypothetical protein
MATVSELIESRSVGRDRDNRVLCTRTFLVDLPPDQVMAAPPAELPVPGISTFLGNTKLVCDRIEADYWANSVGDSIVTASYTTDRSGTLGGVNPNAADFRSWSVEQHSLMQRIPYAAFDDRAWEYVTPTGVEFVGAWVANEITSEETRMVITRRTTTPSMDPDDFSLIQSLLNTIQVIGGEPYLFHAARSDQVQADLWQVEYVFHRDLGTPNIFPNYAPSLGQHGWYPIGLANQIAGAPIGGVFARPPYHAVAGVPWPSSVSSPFPAGHPLPPMFIPIAQKAAPNPTGWQNLPGFN